MKIEQMLGYKLFKKSDDDTVDVIRIIKLRKYKEGFRPLSEKLKEITIRHEGNGNIENVKVGQIEGYTPLEPDGICTFNTVNIGKKDENIKDVIVTATKFLNMKIGDTLPYAVCRQNITDVFYNLLCKDESDMIVGLSVNRDTCPANFDYLMMLACSEILYTDFVNFYRNDILDDILSLVPSLLPYNSVLESTYRKHVESVKNPSLLFKKQDKGWCNNLKTLLHENNFQEDINQMLGITDINPIIKDYLQIKTLPNGEEYESMNDELTLWIASIFKVNIKDNTVIEYNHDINIAEFNNSKYFLLRDRTNKLYLVVYTSEGEYKESDLELEASKKDFSDEFRINFYNKYNLNK